MKFIKEATPKGIHVPAAALKLSGITPDGKAELHTMGNTLVLLNARMTAPELLAASQQLTSLAADLLFHLSKVCGPCEGCGDGEEGCPYDDLEDKTLDLPDYLRQEAGIPEDAKLCAEVDAENSAVILSASGHRHDLRDVPSDLLDVFAEMGVCLGELEEHMILEDTVYGN